MTGEQKGEQREYVWRSLLPSFLGGIVFLTSGGIGLRLTGAVKTLINKWQMRARAYWLEVSWAGEGGVGKAH